MDGGHVLQAAAACQELLAAAAGRDWTRPIPGLDWTVAQAVTHMAEGTLWYATDLAAGPRRLDTMELAVPATTAPAELAATIGAFATVLAGGRTVEGFTDEGLAVVDAGDRLGVVDQRGQVVVAPAYRVLVIHPVAFLIGDGHGRWGALDRNGDPLIDVTHPSQADVTEEIDRLLADTRPVL